MNTTEIKKAIRELKREMKDGNIPVRSCFNGGHTPESYRCNAELFRLKAELEKSKREIPPAPLIPAKGGRMGAIHKHQTP